MVITRLDGRKNGDHRHHALPNGGDLSEFSI
jgi:hypothetical protein